MPDTRRVIRTIEVEDRDIDLVEMLLTSRSDAEAVMAYSLLRETFDETQLVALANLREIIAELPETPFVTGEGLDVLERVAGYESTGRSYRKMFAEAEDVSGLEFLGEGTDCEGVVIYTTTARFYLHGDSRSRIDHSMLAVLVEHEELLDHVLEGLQLLGCPLEPRIYLTVSDFPIEHAAAAAGQALGELF